MVVDIGKNRIRDLIVADISSGVLGTGITIPSSVDTGLQTPLASTSKPLISSVVDKGFTMTHVIDTLTANGSAISEFGIYMNSDAVLMDRFVFPPINKTSSFELTTIVTYKVI